MSDKPFIIRRFVVFCPQTNHTDPDQRAIAALRLGRERAKANAKRRHLDYPAFSVWRVKRIVNAEYVEVHQYIDVDKAGKYP